MGKIEKLKTGMFNTNSYESPDRRYSSFDFVKSSSFAHNGFVSGNGAEFVVSSISGLDIEVAPGIYNIAGHYVENDKNKSFRLNSVPAGKERHDIVVVGVTRDSSIEVDGTSLSREGYVRVIEGTIGEIDATQPNFEDIKYEEMSEGAGIEEVELAIIKIVSGAVSEITDRRTSTNHVGITTIPTKEFSDGMVDFSEYNFYTINGLEKNEDGEIIGGYENVINKEISFRIDEKSWDNEKTVLNKLKIKIDNNVVIFEVIDFCWLFTYSNRIVKLRFWTEGGVLKLKASYNPNAGLVATLSDNTLKIGEAYTLDYAEHFEYKDWLFPKYFATIELSDELPEYDAKAISFYNRNFLFSSSTQHKDEGTGSLIVYNENLEKERFLTKTIDIPSGTNKVSFPVDEYSIIFIYEDYGGLFHRDEIWIKYWNLKDGNITEIFHQKNDTIQNMCPILDGNTLNIALDVELNKSILFDVITKKAKDGPVATDDFYFYSFRAQPFYGAFGYGTRYFVVNYSPRPGEYVTELEASTLSDINTFNSVSYDEGDYLDPPEGIVFTYEQFNLGNEHNEENT